MVSGINHAAPPDPRRWIALSVILVAGFMDLLDVTIVNVALPSILDEFGADYAEVEWVVSAYVLGFAALLITGGRLGDIYGRRTMFLAGATGFTIASALCGLAASPGMLIGSRFLQGATAGLMVPQILAIIHVMFPREERGKVLGIWGGVLGSASAAGLILGGLLVEWDLFGLAWRPIFLVNIPVGVAALIVAWFVVPDSRSPAAARLDPIGMLLAIGAVLLLVYPLTEGRSLGWPSWIYLLLVGSAGVLVLFVAYEWRRSATVGSPLVGLALFRLRAFTAGLLVWLVFWVAMGGFFLVWTLYLQVGLGWSPLRSGLTATTFAVGAAAGSGLSVQVFTPRFGRSVLVAGAVLNAVGFGSYAWLVAHYGPTVEPWQMIAPLVVTGFGFGLVVAPMVDAVLTGVPTRDAGSASGLLSTVQQVGIAVGVAVVGVVFFFHLAADSGRGVDAVSGQLRAQLSASGVPQPGQDAIIDGFRACVHDRSAAVDPTEIPASCRSDGGSDALAAAGRNANAHNFAHTFGLTLWYGVATLALVVVGMFALPRRIRERDLDAELAAVGSDRDV